MAGFLELFARYLDEIGTNPITDAAGRVRADTSRADREETARDVERIADVLGLKGSRR